MNTDLGHDTLKSPRPLAQGSRLGSCKVMLSWKRGKCFKSHTRTYLGVVKKGGSNTSVHTPDYISLFQRPSTNVYQDRRQRPWWTRHRDQANKFRTSADEHPKASHDNNTNHPYVTDMLGNVLCMLFFLKEIVLVFKTVSTSHVGAVIYIFFNHYIGPLLIEGFFWIKIIRIQIKYSFL